VLVELAHLGMNDAGIERRFGQSVQRGDDADVPRAALEDGADGLRVSTQVVDTDVTGRLGERHDEPHPVGRQRLLRNPAVIELSKVYEQSLA